MTEARLHLSSIAAFREAPARPRAALNGTLHALARVFALQDVMMLAYLAVTGLMVGAAPAGPLRPGCARVVATSMAALVVGCLVGRGMPRVPARVRAVFYRCAILGVLLSNYLALRDLLELVCPFAVDGALARLDLRLFGVEPALWLERFNRRPIVEWFSFFYFSYFFLCAAFMVAVVWLMGPTRRTAEFAVGTILVYCVGQLGYAAVPAYGPLQHFQAQFHGEIDGGFFWSCVCSTVKAGGAMRDAFPSLHTAAPLWFTLFAWHQARGDRRWRPVAIVTGFFSANIIVSTMLLRWHYGIDVVAGVALAVAAGVLSPRLSAFEASLRRAWGLADPWCFDLRGASVTRPTARRR